MTLVGSVFYGVLFVPFIFAILQEAASEGRAITPFGSEVYVSRGAWVASFVFLATVSIYTMGVFNMVLSEYMYSLLLFSVVLLVLLQQACFFSVYGVYMMMHGAHIHLAGAHVAIHSAHARAR